TYDYDAFGTLTQQQEKTENAFKYAGEYLDAETGLYDLNARYYDPSMGRFINEDTHEGQMNNPLSHNLYTYVLNNPLIYVDPTGHDHVVGAGGAGGVSHYGYWESTWNAFVKVNSNWYTAIDYWSSGTLSDLNEYYKISQEKPLSLEQFAAAGYLVFQVLPSSKVEAKLTKKGTEYIDTAIAKAAKGCNCFTAGTKVQTDEGEKNIEDIQVGDKVLSKNETTGEIAYKEVTDTFNHETDEIYNIHVGDQTIESTYNHPFYVKDKRWTFVKDLKVGDLLVQSDGSTLKIESIELFHKHVTVYNMTVDEFHTYFVSDLGVWVHNISCEEINWKGFSSGKLKPHWEKHGNEFGDISQNEYLKLAKGFAAETDSSFKEQVVGNFLVKYDPSTGRVLVGHIKDRQIRTFYKDDGRSADPFQAAIDLAKSLGGG
ncbi:polymorphic toxin-type HINT domain-containing protein, partial [Paenibacillus sp. SGZ-1009]|uniref:polymorphic toxin-type HINT domain-containing protein n=1 Tax=Paenibacillus campi TaxID=3106031 RepID=UPI002AFEFC71